MLVIIMYEPRLPLSPNVASSPPLALSCCLRLVFVVLAALALATPPSMRADSTHSYSQSNSTQTSHPGWMKWVPDATPLNLIALPGTHDSMARFGGTLAETQQLELLELLYSGVRALDIRCKLTGGTFKIYHGITYQYATFDDVLATCNLFLDLNPSEVIIMRVADEGSNDNDAWKRKLQDYRSGNLGSRIWTGNPNGGANKPVLGTVRGKIIIREDLDWTVNDSTLYNVQWAWNISYRWADTWLFFNYMDGNIPTYPARETPGDTEYATYTTPADNSIFYINSASGTSENGAVHPYSVASYVNPRALAYLFGGNQNRFTGILQADFPGGALISAILAHNMKRVTSEAAIALMASDFDQMWDQICYSADADGRDSASARTSALSTWLHHIIPDHYWGVIASGATSADDWGYAITHDGLHTVSEEISGWKYVAVNALALNSGVTSAGLQAFLTDARLQTLSGTAQNRATTLLGMLRRQFPGINWNLSVKRVAASGDWAVSLDASASLVNKLVLDESEYWLYTVWATSKYNLPPVPNPGGPYVVGEGSYLTLDAGASTDPDTATNRLAYRWDLNHDGLWDTPYATYPTLLVRYTNQTSQTVGLLVTDGATEVATTVAITVTNVPPVWNLGTGQSVHTGQLFTRSCSFTDPGSDLWTVTVNYGDGSPVAALPHTNKVVLLSHAWATPGSKTITLTVNDGSATPTGTIPITVADLYASPQITAFNGPATPAIEGTSLTVTGEFYDPTWIPSRGATIYWDSFTQPQDITPYIVAHPGGIFSFSVPHAYPTNGFMFASVYVLGFNRNVIIPVANATPVIDFAEFPATRVEGQSFSSLYQINDPGADTWTFSFDFGDGTGVSYGSSDRSGFTPSHAYTNSGTYIIAMTVTDSDGASAELRHTVPVTDAAPFITQFTSVTANPVEGSAVAVSGTFTSDNLSHDRFTVTMDWGDGTPATPAFVQGFSTVLKSFSATHIYHDNNGANPWTVTATVMDDDGSTFAATVAVPVSNLPPVVLAGRDFGIPSGSVLTESGVITDPGLDTFTGTVNYGDGTGTQPLAVIGNSFQFNHTFPSNGIYAVAVQITDDDGATGNDTVQVLVGPVRDLLVTNTNDSGPGSLRLALQEVNTPGPNSAFTEVFSEIRFAPALSGGTIALTSGQLPISNRVHIAASALPNGIAISGNASSRIFRVALSNVVVLEDVHLLNGAAGGSPSAGLGGGVLVDAYATLALNGCTFSSNSASASGGAIYAAGTARVTANNSTFVGNQAGGAAVGSGGAILNLGTLALNHCTVVGNRTVNPDGWGGGISSSGPGSSAALTNCIVADNSGFTDPNLNGIFSGTHNFTNGSPQLLQLGRYGGRTPTMPPRPGSPVIDAIPAPSLPMPMAPLAYWRLGEDDANATNGAATLTASNQLGGALAFNVPATFTGNVSPVAAGWVDSRLGLHFAAGTYATNPIVTDLTDNFGLELWVRPDATNGTRCLAYNGNSGPNGWGLYLHEGKYQGLFGSVAFLTGPPAVLGEWTHLALVRDDGVTTLYVNGAAIVTSLLTPGVPSGRFALGAQPQSLAAEFFSGSLDEVRVFGLAPGQFNPAILLYQPAAPAGSSASLAVDQRGFPRLSHAAADFGSVEVQQASVRMKNDAGAGSLRETLDSIAPAGIVTFAPALAGQSIVLASELSFSKNGLLLDGAGLSAGVALDGGPGANRVLTVAAGSTMEARALTFTGGSGGGVDSPQLGGAVFNRGALIFDRCTFVSNSALYGAALFNESGGYLTLQRCTFSGNQASVEAGAIYNRGNLSLTDCTIAGNASAVSFGGVYNDNGRLATVGNSILAGNLGASGADLENRGTLNRVGANLFQSVMGGGLLTGPAHLSGPPLLAALGQYGGPTPTMPLRPGSPAIDAGTVTTFTTDQRGFPRVIGVASDLGAVEGVLDSNVTLVNPTLLTSGAQAGAFQFGFQNLSGLQYPVWASTNAAAPSVQWSYLGAASEPAAGQFLFTDLEATNYPHRFYRVATP
jgi:predicted outer membrane repeat protein